jgi:hypothetical protein
MSSRIRRDIPTPESVYSDEGERPNGDHESDSETDPAADHSNEAPQPRQNRNRIVVGVDFGTTNSGKNPWLEVADVLHTRSYSPEDPASPLSVE